MGTLRILFMKEGPKWAAQCLEHDIAAQGDSLRQAARAIVCAIIAEMAACEELRTDIDSIPRAHDYYWKLFESNESVGLPADVAPVIPPAYQIPHPELRLTG